MFHQLIEYFCERLLVVAAGGLKIKVGRKLLGFPPTRLSI